MKRINIGFIFIFVLFTFSIPAFAGTKEEADTYLNKDLESYSVNDLQNTISQWEKALAIYREIGDRKGERNALTKIGGVYYDLGRLSQSHPYSEKALTYYEKTLKIDREIGDREAESSDLRMIGSVYMDLNQYEVALPYVLEALRIEKENGLQQNDSMFDDLIAKEYSSLGEHEESHANYEQAIIYYEAALKIERLIVRRKREGDTLRQIGLVYWKLNEYEKALSYYEEALKMHRKTGDREGEGDDLYYTGIVYADLGQSEKSICSYEEALKIFRENGDWYSEGVVLNNIGNVYDNLGYYRKSLSYYKQSLTNFEQMLKLFRDSDERDYEDLPLLEIGGEVFTNIGTVYLSLGQYEDSLYYYEQALKMNKDVGDWNGEGTNLANIGVAYNALRQYEKALYYYEQALKIMSEIEDQDVIYRIAWGMGRSYKGLKKYSEAVPYYVMSIEALESIRGELKSEEFKTSFMGDKMDVYKELIELLMEMNRHEDAFNYVERARSRAFLDMLATRGLDVKDEKSEELLQKEAELRTQLEGLRKSETTLREEPMGTEGRTAREAVVWEAQEEYTKLIKDIHAANPELASLVSVDVMTLDQVQKLLPADTHIVEFFTTDKNTYVFVVGKKDFSVRSVAMGEEDLANKVAEFRVYLKTMNGDLFAKSSKGIYDLLLGSALKDINKEKIIIVPYGPLHYLPFAALYDGEKHLVDRHTLIVDPSASVLKYILEKRKGVGGCMIALGNPNTEFKSLPYAEEEVSDIKDVMGSGDTYMKDKATETVGKEKFADYNVVHLACHGSFNEAEPLMSSLYLAKDDANDGRLMVYELFGLDLTKSSLVVLSACDTGISKVMTGDELIGLSRGFIFAGTPSLLATLWEVDDKSTSDLMVEFYKNLKSGMAKPEALRRAQLWLKSQKGYESPYYWAPFEMIGDWQ